MGKRYVMSRKREILEEVAKHPHRKKEILSAELMSEEEFETLREKYKTFGKEALKVRKIDRYRDGVKK